MDDPLDDATNLLDPTADRRLAGAGAREAVSGKAETSRCSDRVGGGFRLMSSTRESALESEDPAAAAGCVAL